MHTSDLHEAIRSLRDAIELNPALAIAHNMLARVLSSFERHEEALAAAQKPVSLDLAIVMCSATDLAANRLFDARLSPVLGDRAYLSAWSVYGG